jgi:hypothetical protein
LALAKDARGLIQVVFHVLAVAIGTISSQAKVADFVVSRRESALLLAHLRTESESRDWECGWWDIKMSRRFLESAANRETETMPPVEIATLSRGCD